jgi:hypothetical protein
VLIFAVILLYVTKYCVLALFLILHILYFSFQLAVCQQQCSAQSGPPTHLTFIALCLSYCM